MTFVDATRAAWPAGVHGAVAAVGATTVRWLPGFMAAVPWCAVLVSSALFGLQHAHLGVKGVVVTAATSLVFALVHHSAAV